MRAIFARRRTFGNAHPDADHLRLVRRQGDAARAERDHVERQPFGGRDIGLIDLVEPADRGHPLDLEADAIGRRFGPDIVQHHFGATRSVEHDARRRDKQIARRLNRHRYGTQQKNRKQAEAFEKAQHGYDPHNRLSGRAHTRPMVASCLRQHG